MKLSARQGLAYGLLGLPLAFVALPLYIILPNHYAREFGVPLATLGSLLLGARLFERERTGYRLTAAGEKLVEALEPVDRRLSALPRDFAASGSGSDWLRKGAAGSARAAAAAAFEAE